MDDCPNTESIWCKTVFLGVPFVIGAVYRRPNAPISFLESLQDYMCNNVPPSTRIIIAGDFNLPGIDWADLTVGSTDVTHCEALINLSFSYDLTQIVRDNTRISPTSESLLDLVLISSNVTECSVSVKDGLSDHKLVLLSVKEALPTKDSKKSTICIRDYSNTDDVSILDCLELSLDSFDGATDVNTLWNRFKNMVNSCLDEYVPKRTKAVKKCNPWINRKIIQLKRKIRRKSRNKEKNKTEISQLSRTLKHMIETAKDHFYSQTLPYFMRDSQRFWRHLAPSREQIQYVCVDNNIINDCTEIAEKIQ